MIPECKIALIKSWIGGATIALALIVVLLGKDQYFGYLDGHLVGISVLALILLIVGAYLAASYMRCIMSLDKMK